MIKHNEAKEKLMSVGMITEAEAMDTLYNTRGSHIQGRLQKLAVRVEIPSFGETERAFAVLYFKSDVDELKAEKTQAIQSIDPAIVDAIAEAVLAKLGGK